jgi:hypothetical protein
MLTAGSAVLRLALCLSSAVAPLPYAPRQDALAASVIDATRNLTHMCHDRAVRAGAPTPCSLAVAGAAAAAHPPVCHGAPASHRTLPARALIPSPGHRGSHRRLDASTSHAPRLRAAPAAADPLRPEHTPPHRRRGSVASISAPSPPPIGPLSTLSSVPCLRLSAATSCYRRRHEIPLCGPGGGGGGGERAHGSTQAW